MGSKRLDLKIRIILFLLCTIGILYVSIKLLYKPCFEGFQTYHSCQYDTVLLPGRGMWKCPTEIDAMALQSDLTIPPLNETDAICYLAPNTDSNTQYYTCYQRPTGKYFSVTDGVYVAYNSLEDTTPTTIVDDISQVCNDYNGEFSKFITNIKSTMVYQGLVSTASYNVTGTVKILSNISSSYCPSEIDTTNSKYFFCSTLNTGIQIFTGLERGPISGLSTQITNLYNQLSSLYTSQFIPAYNGFNC